MVMGNIRPKSLMLDMSQDYLGASGLSFSPGSRVNRAGGFRST